MSVSDRLLAGAKDVLLLQYKVEQLADRVERMAASNENLRERVLRIEVLIEEAQRRAAERGPARLQ